jgi:hypothetical protein
MTNSTRPGHGVKRHSAQEKISTPAQRKIFRGSSPGYGTARFRDGLVSAEILGARMAATGWGSGPPVRDTRESIVNFSTAFLLCRVFCVTKIPTSLVSQ